MCRLRLTLSVLACLMPGLYLARGQNTSDSLDVPVENFKTFATGGEIRSRIRFFNGINFGDVDSSELDHDAYINIRGIVFGDFKPNSTFRVYAQMITGYTFLKDRSSSKDNDILSVGQLFVEMKLKSIPLKVRIGRQEMSYGSGKILGTSNGPNVLGYHDGIAMNLELATVSGSLFYARPVILKKDIFDNTTSADNSFFGTYWSVGLENDRYFDLYFFGNDLRETDFLDMMVNEYRFTIGSRISKESGRLIYEAEAAWQIGKSGHQKISAFFAYASAGFSFQHTRLNPAIRMSGTIYSGDKDPSDPKVNIFRPVRARPPVNVMVPFGPSNIITLIPEGSIMLTRKIDMSLRYYFVWRLTSQDGLYSTSMDEQTRSPEMPPENTGIFVANGFVCQIGYTPNGHFDFSLSSGIFFPGSYIRHTGIGKVSRATFLVAYYRF